MSEPSPQEARIQPGFLTYQEELLGRTEDPGGLRPSGLGSDAALVDAVKIQMMEHEGEAEMSC